MIKIREAVRYGSELKDIEFAQFPELSDTVKTVLDFPVGIQTAVKDRAIAVGKFLQGDIAGNLLASMPLGFKNVEELYYEFPGSVAWHDFVFDQKVYVVLIWMSDFIYWNWTRWYDLTHTVLLQSLEYGSPAVLGFVGTTVAIQTGCAGDGWVKMHAYGFY